MYYLDQAKQAGAAGPALQGQTQEVLKRLTQMAHAAIQQRNFSDADRIVAELHGVGATQAAISSLQRDTQSGAQSANGRKSRSNRNIWNWPSRVWHRAN